MKNKNLPYLIVGGLLLLVGISIFITEQYWNGITNEVLKDTIKDISTSLNSSDFDINNITDGVGSNVSSGYYSEDDFKNVSINALSSDQIIGGISVYKNAIEIPSVNIATQVNEGTDTEALHSGAGHFKDTANIGESGNFVICGHASETYRCIFNSLANIGLYDKIYAYDRGGNEYIYTVTEMNIVQPNDWSVVRDGLGSDDKLMTIITCCDNGQRRLIVRAQVLTDEEVEMLIANRRSLNLKAASNYNNSENVSLLYDYFTNTDGLVIKKYNISNAITKQRSTTRYELYNAVLENNIELKEHKYPLDYNINVGFDLDNRGGI